MLHDDTCNTYDIEFQCKEIKIMNNFKYLGIEMCSNMKWNDQINSITQKRQKNDLLNERISKYPK